MTATSASHVVALMVMVCLLSFHSMHPCAFQPRMMRKAGYPFRSSIVLKKASDGGGGEDETQVTNKDKGNDKKAAGRAGGRRKRMPIEPKEEKRHQNSVPLIVFFSLLLCIAPFFASDDTAPRTNYYYYESSYSVSRVYSQDGSIQTIRKENVQTNVPSLLEGRKLLKDERFDEQGYSRPSIEHDDF